MAKVYRDLRDFLETLEKEGQLVRIKEEVSPEPAISAAGRGRVEHQERTGRFI